MGLEMVKLSPYEIQIRSSLLKQFREGKLSTEEALQLKELLEREKEEVWSSGDNQWLSHGRRIDYNKAKDLGLNVTLIDRNDMLWKNLWEYYSRAFTFLNNTSDIKLLESESAGLNLGGPRIPPQQQKLLFWKMSTTKLQNYL